MRKSSVAKVGGMLASAALLALLTGTPAQASEGTPLAPNRVTCGVATCTAYWSVDRTAEMHAEWKETVVGAGAVAAAGAAFAGALTATAASGPAAPIVGAAAAGAAVVIAARSVEFNHMINGAENDGRCLIYKFPRGAALNGWFASVHLNNENCDRGPV